jgi:hypothetical protein
VFDVFDVMRVLLDPGIPVAGFGGTAHRRLELREGFGQLAAGERPARHTQN